MQIVIISIYLDADIVWCYSVYFALFIVPNSCIYSVHFSLVVLIVVVCLCLLGIHEI